MNMVAMMLMKHSKIIKLRIIMIIKIPAFAGMTMERA